MPDEEQGTHTVTEPTPVSHTTTRPRSLPAAAQDAIAALTLALLTVLFYWRILTPNPLNRGAFPKGDFIEQFYAFALFRARELVSGHLPLWNPYAFGGHPFIADIQSAVFYPPSWVTTALAGPGGYPLFALEVEAIVHIFLAGFGAYLLASRVSGSRVAGLLGSLVFAFGGYLSAYPSQQLSVLEVQTWMPWVLYFVYRTTTLHRPIANAALGGLFLGLAIQAGHPQAAMYLVYTVTAYFVFRLLAIDGLSAWKTSLRRWYLLAITLGIGFAVAAVQLLPTIEFMGVSTRNQIPYEMSGWAFPLRDILQIILPGSVSYYSPMYVGIIPLTLAFVAAFWHRNRETLFWVGLALVGLLLSFGGNTIIHSVMYNVAPGFGTFRHQERGIVIFATAMSVLSAIGARVIFTAELQRLGRYVDMLFRCALAAIAVFIAIYVAGLGLEETPPVQNTAAFLVMVFVLATAFVAFRMRGLPNSIFVVLFIVVTAFDLITTNWLTNFAKVLPESYYRPTEIQKYLQKNDANGRTYNDYQYPLNYGDVFKIRDINGASPLVVDRYRTLFNSEPKEKVWRILGVKYFVTWQGGYPAEKISVEALDAERSANLYALPDPLPRAYVAHSARVIREDVPALHALLANDTDPGTTAILATDPALAPSGSNRQTAARVQDISTDHIVVETTLGEPGILVLNEVYYPGWRATVNGAPAEILRAQFTQRGVALPAGTHRVEFIFDPWTLKAGAALTVLGLITGLGTVAIFWRRTVNPSSHGPGYHKQSVR